MEGEAEGPSTQNLSSQGKASRRNVEDNASTEDEEEHDQQTPADPIPQEVEDIPSSNEKEGNSCEDMEEEEQRPDAQDKNDWETQSEVVHPTHTEVEVQGETTYADNYPQ